MVDVNYNYNAIQILQITTPNLALLTPIIEPLLSSDPTSPLSINLLKINSTNNTSTSITILPTLLDSESSVPVENPIVPELLPKDSNSPIPYYTEQ